MYSKWYVNLNNSLNSTSEILAENLNGIPLMATTSEMSSQIKSVKEYFPLTVSHRVHAEHSGIGWRGKNGLIVNQVYSCMIRARGLI
jgi:epoxyqueuosine reductase QueG